MAAWSAENATNAYLHTLKSGNNSMQPDAAEFISALAAGSGSRLIVEVRANAAGPTTMALVAAAQQTSGKVLCILPNQTDVESSIRSFPNSNIEFVTGDATMLLRNDYRGADFVLVDCELEGHEKVFEAAQVSAKGGAVVVGRNAFSCGGEGVARSDAGNLLPIGGGVRICRVKDRAAAVRKSHSQWVVRVDECTGEEHVYRVTGGSSRRKGIRA